MDYKEEVLTDDYPVYYAYYYIIDGQVTRSPLTGTVKDLKLEYNAMEIKSCDILGRKIIK